MLIFEQCNHNPVLQVCYHISFLILFYASTSILCIRNHAVFTWVVILCWCLYAKIAKTAKTGKTGKNIHKTEERITKQPSNFEKFSGSMMFGVLCTMLGSLV